uniref:Cache domain-containing protein n=1 Tax=Ciona savignyi TaxID=51511 RepID=H2ZMZ9_CIOSA
MARQDFSFHNLTVDTSICPTCDQPKPGVFHKVIETKNLRSAMGSYYSFFAKHKSSSEASHAAAEVVWSVPYYDVGGLGLVVTAAAPVVVNDKLVGVVGVDLTMHELIADVTYFSVAANMGYAFLLDIFGKVMMHPLLPSPAAVSDDPVITGVEAFERSPDVLNFINDVIQHECIGSEEYCVYTGIFNMDHILPSATRR